jgi:hypothetical protein
MAKPSSKSFLIFLGGVATTVVGALLIGLISPTFEELGRRLQTRILPERRAPSLAFDLIRYNTDGTMKIYVTNSGTATAIIERFEACLPRFIIMWDRKTSSERTYDSNPPIYTTHKIEEVEYDMAVAGKMFSQLDLIRDPSKEAGCGPHGSKPGMPYILRVLNGERQVAPDSATELKVEPFPEYELFSMVERNAIGSKYFCLITLRANRGRAYRMFLCDERAVRPNRK